MPRAYRYTSSDSYISNSSNGYTKTRTDSNKSSTYLYAGLYPMAYQDPGTDSHADANRYTDAVAPIFNGIYRRPSI